MTRCTEKRARRQSRTRPARGTFCPNRGIFQGEDLPGVRPEGHAIPALSGIGKARTAGPAFPAISGATGARSMGSPEAVREGRAADATRKTGGLPWMMRSGRTRGTARRMRRATVRRRFLSLFGDKVRRRATRKRPRHAQHQPHGEEHPAWDADGMSTVPAFAVRGYGRPASGASPRPYRVSARV